MSQTPKFDIDQDEHQITITICAPYTNVKDTEIFVEEFDFKFCSPPYLLELTLPGKIKETDESSAKYDVDAGTFTVKVDKVCPGEHFQNLDLLLGQIPKEESKQAIPKIQILDGNSKQKQTEVTFSVDDWMNPFDVSLADKDWEEANMFGQHRYGFANRHYGLSTSHELQLKETTQVMLPDQLSLSDRRQRRIAKEQVDFDEEQYVSDFMILELRSVLGPFNPQDQLCLLQPQDIQNLSLSNYGLLDIKWRRRLYFGLIDILFAYCYDRRVTHNEHSCESSATICRISPTLAWFDVFDNLEDMVVACLRRSVVYPIYRRWDFSMRVFQDVVQMFESVTSNPPKIAEPANNWPVTFALMNVYSLFAKTDPFYLINQLYIESYIGFVACASSSNFVSLGQALAKVLGDITKENCDLDLDILEVAAKATAEEEEME